MVHAFCLGPIGVERGPAAFAGFAFSDARGEQPVFAPSEQACLAAIAERHRGQPLFCEPSLSRVGRALGFEPRELPRDVLVVRAGMAVSLANGRALSPLASPASVVELLEASADFFAGKPWERYDSETLVHLRVEGVMNAWWEASVLGSHGQEFGIGVYFDPGTHAKLHAVAHDPVARRALTSRVSALSITYEQDPPYAVEAIEQLTGVPFVPVPVYVERGKMRGAEAKHLVVMAAALRSAASADRVGVAEVGNLRARVTIIVGEPPHAGTASAPPAPKRRTRR